MRIILFFLLGVISAFYLSELLRKIPFFKHSLLGITFIFAGIIFSSIGPLDQSTRVLVGLFLSGSGVGMILHHLLRESFIFNEKLEKNFVKKHENGFERFLEIIPGALTWIALSSP